MSTKHRLLRGIVLGLTLASFWAPTPVTADTCASEAHEISFRSLVRGATLIVIGRVTSTETAVTSPRLDVDVERVLKGEAGPEIHLGVDAEPDCPYPWGIPAPGDRIVLATADPDDPSQPTTDFWVIGPDGTTAWGWPHDGVLPDTLDALLEAIRTGRLPDTATVAPPVATDTGPRDGARALALVAVFVGALFVALRQFRPRGTRREGARNRAIRP